MPAQSPFRTRQEPVTARPKKTNRVSLGALMTALSFIGSDEANQLFSLGWRFRRPCLVGAAPPGPFPWTSVCLSSACTESPVPESDQPSPDVGPCEAESRSAGSFSS